MKNGDLMSTTRTERMESALADSAIQFTLNGRNVEADAADTRSLLSILREDFGCTSLKNGCEPQASCGCCLMLVDGKPRLACTMKPAQAAGKQVTTLEGISEQERGQLAESFVRSGGVQCGF